MLMGLDMYLFKKSKNIKIQIINSLNDESGYKEVMYWRKCWNIHDWFCNNFEVENCKHIKIEREDLLALIEYLKYNDGNGDEYGMSEEEGEDFNENQEINSLMKIIEKTDWDNEEIYYWAWW